MMYNISMCKNHLRVALLASVFISGVSLAGVPAIKKQCDICHLPHTMAGEALLRAPISELCVDCHQDRKPPGDHVVDVVPSMPVGNLPLDEGMMTCVTCHDPHGSAGFPKLLRDKPGRLCSHCHKM